jgi:hypothetical protein
MFLVVASDGVWDTMSNDLVAKFVLVNTCKIVNKSLQVGKWYELLSKLQQHWHTFRLLTAVNSSITLLSVQQTTRCFVGFRDRFPSVRGKNKLCFASRSYPAHFRITALITSLLFLLPSSRENGSSDNVSCIVANLKSKRRH